MKILISALILLATINVASARDFYTRKHVHGHWIHGHFHRHHQWRHRHHVVKIQENAYVHRVEQAFGNLPKTYIHFSKGNLHHD